MFGSILDERKRVRILLARFYDKAFEIRPWYEACRPNIGTSFDEKKRFLGHGQILDD